MTTIFLLIIFLQMGEPEVVAMRVPTMDLCTDAMPNVAKKVPPGAIVLCVDLTPKGADT